jgi:hypothetical protein
MAGFQAGQGKQFYAVRVLFLGTPNQDANSWLMSGSVCRKEFNIIKYMGK